MVASGDAEASDKIPKDGKGKSLCLEWSSAHAIDGEDGRDGECSRADPVYFLERIPPSHGREGFCRLEGVLNIIVWDIRVYGCMRRGLVGSLSLAERGHGCCCCSLTHQTDPFKDAVEFVGIGEKSGSRLAETTTLDIHTRTAW